MRINTSCLEDLKIDFSTCRAAGVDYVVTTGTGEGTFAYLRSDIEEESERFDAMSCGFESRRWHHHFSCS